MSRKLLIYECRIKEAIKQRNTAYKQAKTHFIIWRVVILIVALLLMMFAFPMFVVIVSGITVKILASLGLCSSITTPLISLVTIILFFLFCILIALRALSLNKKMNEYPYYEFEYRTIGSILSMLRFYGMNNFVTRTFFDFIAYNFLILFRGNYECHKPVIELDEVHLELAVLTLQLTENNRVINYQSYVDDEELSKYSVYKKEKVVKLLEELNFIAVNETPTGKTFYQLQKPEYKY